MKRERCSDCDYEDFCEGPVAGCDCPCHDAKMLITSTIELSCKTCDFKTGPAAVSSVMLEGLHEATEFHKQQRPSHDIKLTISVDFVEGQECKETW